MTGDDVHGGCKTAAHGVAPRVTVAVPSLDQGSFIEEALQSILDQDVALEVFVVDGGSTDNTSEILHRWRNRLDGWRSTPDNGQAAAINEAISCGTAPFVCWLNSDDRYLPGALRRLSDALDEFPDAPAAYGRVLNDRGGKLRPIPVEPFSPARLAKRCIISQPGTLIRRDAWCGVGGLREDLVMALDYDLWWRLYRDFGDLISVPDLVAVNRDHPESKTNRWRRLHYREAMAVVREHSGGLPLCWWLRTPYSVWYRTLKSSARQKWHELQWK